MIELILFLVVLGVVLWGLEQLPMDGTIKQVVRVLIIVLVVIMVARVLLGAFPDSLRWPL